MIHGIHAKRWYIISKCFSEYDITNDLTLCYDKKAVLAGIASAGRMLFCEKVSISGRSGWFRVGSRAVAIHKKFLTLAPNQEPPPPVKRPYEVVVTVDRKILVSAYSPEEAADTAAMRANMDLKNVKVLGTCKVSMLL